MTSVPPSSVRLLPEGRRVAEEINRCFYESFSAHECGRRAENEYGWHIWGKGQMRWMFLPMPDEHVATVGRTAVKVSLDNGEPQTRAEIENWKKITGETPAEGPYHLLRGLVVPLGSWDEDGRWLSMQFVELPGDHPRDSPAGYGGDKFDAWSDVQRKMIDLGFYMDDLHADNIGLIDGRPVILDYGHPIEYVGSRVEEVWDGE